MSIAENTVMNRIDRLFAVLLLLQVKRRITAREIAEQFDITERTVYRDLKALSEMGVPLASQAGEGYSLLDSFALPPIALTEGEARAATLALRWFVKNSAGTLHDNAQTLLYKLEAASLPLLRAQMRALAQLIDYYPTHAPLDWEQPGLAGIIRAIEQRQVLRIAYRGYHHIEPVSREIEPLRLTFSQGAWYVEAYCSLRHDQRSFRLNRILSQEPTAETFTPRIIVPARLERIEVHVRFAANVLPQVLEHPHYGFVREQGDTLVFHVHTLSEIQHWLFGFGSAAEVVQPEALRQWIKDEAQRLIKLLT